MHSSAFEASYKTFYVAGPTIEGIHEVKPLKTIVSNLIAQYEAIKINF